MSSTVLIVDDNDSLSNLMRRSLETKLSDVQVTCCASAAELKEYQTPFDLVVLDWTLPDASGPEVLEQLMSDWPDSAIVLVSGNTIDRLSTEQQAGVSCSLLKPFEPGELAATVRRLLDGAASIPACMASEQSTTVSAPGRSRIDRQRHGLVNCLSRLLSGVRAFETDLRADAEDPDLVRRHTDEYVDRLVENIHEMNELLTCFARGAERS